MSGYRSSDFWRGYVLSGRPHTGLYAFLLAFVSFKFFAWQEWHVGLLISLLFGFITMSIMRFNDYVDEKNDVRKGKVFASQNKNSLFVAWCFETLVIGAVLLWLSILNVQCALFCTVVWGIGVFYSFVPHWYLINNCIVALCSGSPALCASVYFGKFDGSSFFTFLSLTILILVSEIHKDVEDVKTDVGYKATLPTRIGNTLALMIAIAGLHIAALFLTLHPVRWMVIVTATLVPYLAYTQAQALLDSQKITKTFSAMKFLIAGIGIILYVY